MHGRCAEGRAATCSASWLGGGSPHCGSVRCRPRLVHVELVRRVRRAELAALWAVLIICLLLLAVRRSVRTPDPLDAERLARCPGRAVRVARIQPCGVPHFDGSASEPLRRALLVPGPAHAHSVRRVPGDRPDRLHDPVPRWLLSAGIAVGGLYVAAVGLLQQSGRTPSSGSLLQEGGCSPPSGSRTRSPPTSSWRSWSPRRFSPDQRRCCA